MQTPAILEIQTLFFFSSSCTAIFSINTIILLQLLYHTNVLEERCKDYFHIFILSYNHTSYYYIVACCCPARAIRPGYQVSQNIKEIGTQQGHIMGRYYYSNNTIYTWYSWIAQRKKCHEKLCCGNVETGRNFNCGRFFFFFYQI